MNLSIMLAEQIIVMAIMILFGVVFTRLGVITLEDSAPISKVTLYIICPCLLINSFQIEFTSDRLVGLGLAFAAAIFVHGLLIVTGLTSGKLLGLDQTEQASIIYTNCGNLLVPIIGYMMGDEYVFYCCAYMSVQTLLIWTQGITLIRGKGHLEWKKIIGNLNILAIFIGLFLFFTGLRLPGALGTAVGRIGSCVGPVSMIIVGILIGSSNLKDVFSRKGTWLVSFMRLIFCPLMVVAIFAITNITHITADAEKILFVTFLASAAPSASTVSQMASIYHKNEIMAGAINIMSVILCIITMPFMTWFYQFFCY